MAEDPPELILDGEDSWANISTQYHDDSESDKATQYHHMTRMIQGLMAVVLSFIGIPGNTVVIIIMRRKAFRTSSVATYLIVLAVLDIVVLVLEMSRMLVMGALDYNYRDYDVDLCIVHHLLLTTCIALCNWVLVLIALGRWVHLRYSSKFSRLPVWCGDKLTIVVLVVGVSLGQILLTFQGDLRQNFGHIKTQYVQFDCNKHEADSTSRRPSFMSYMIMASIPWVLLILLSIMIFCEVKQTSSRTSSGTNITIAKRIALRERNVALPLLVAILQFLASNLPTMVVYMITYLRNSLRVDKVDREQSRLVNQICMVFLYAGYATNCLMYMLFGSRSRAELKRISLTVRRKIPCVRGRRISHKLSRLRSSESRLPKTKKNSSPSKLRMPKTSEPPMMIENGISSSGSPIDPTAEREDYDLVDNFSEHSM